MMDLAERIETERKEAVAKLWAHLGKLTDRTLLILKSHLLIEENVNAILDVLLPNAIVLREARLTFAQKVRVLRALEMYPGLHRNLDGSVILNTMRNKLAHELEPSGLEEDVVRFIECVRSTSTFDFYAPDGSLHNNFIRSVVYLCGSLGAYRHSVKGIEIQYNDLNLSAS